MRHTLIIKAALDMKFYPNVKEKYVMGKQVCTCCYTEVNMKKKKSKLLLTQIVANDYAANGNESKFNVIDFKDDNTEVQIFINSDIVNNILNNNYALENIKLKAKHFLPKDNKIEDDRFPNDPLKIAAILKKIVKQAMESGLDIHNKAKKAFPDVETPKGFTKIETPDDLLNELNLFGEVLKDMHLLDKNALFDEDGFPRPIQEVKKMIDDIKNKTSDDKVKPKEEVKEAPKKDKFEGFGLENALIYVSKNKSKLNVVYDYNTKEGQAIYQISSGPLSAMVKIMKYLKTVNPDERPGTLYNFTEAAVRKLENEFKDISFYKVQ